MTTRDFDAPASDTRRRSRSSDRSRRPIVRIAWLIALFTSRDTVRYESYGERFERSLRSFRRDLAALRDAGLYPESDLHGEYRMLCFRPEPDAG